MGKLVDSGKESYFENKGYTWESSIDSYVNREQWKVFKREYIDDHHFDTLLADLEEPPLEGQWKIYSNTESEEELHTIKKHYGATS
jgi:hypothetical protein